MNQPQQEQVILIGQSSEVVSKVIKALVSKCVFTKVEFYNLLVDYPRASWLGNNLRILITRVREVVPSAELLKIMRPTTRNWRVFSFPQSFWLIYRDEPQCREVVAEFLYSNLYSEVFSLTPRTALAVVRLVLKNNGVKEEVIRLVQKRLRDALYVKKKQDKTMQ